MSFDKIEGWVVSAVLLPLLGMLGWHYKILNRKVDEFPDHYVRRDDHRQNLQDLKETIGRIETHVTEGFSRIERRLDDVIGREK